MPGTKFGRYSDPRHMARAHPTARLPPAALQRLFCVLNLLFLKTGIARVCAHTQVVSVMGPPVPVAPQVCCSFSPGSELAQRLPAPATQRAASPARTGQVRSRIGPARICWMERPACVQHARLASAACMRRQTRGGAAGGSQPWVSRLFVRSLDVVRAAILAQRRQQFGAAERFVRLSVGQVSQVGQQGLLLGRRLHAVDSVHKHLVGGKRDGGQVGGEDWEGRGEEEGRVRREWGGPQRGPGEGRQGGPWSTRSGAQQGRKVQLAKVPAESLWPAERCLGGRGSACARYGDDVARHGPAWLAWDPPPPSVHPMQPSGHRPVSTPYNPPAQPHPAPRGGPARCGSRPASLRSRAGREGGRT